MSLSKMLQEYREGLRGLPTYEELAAIALHEQCADPIVERNVSLLRQRSIVGVQKYGTTLADNKLPLRAWLNHALEEALDQANYLQAAMQEIDTAAAHQMADASEDAELFGIGYLVDGVNVHPSRVTVLRPTVPVQTGNFPQRDQSKPAEQQGVFQKFDVRRTDGSSAPGGKHNGCSYFVLDVDHDVLAKPALQAYAAACAATHPDLSADMVKRFNLAPAKAQEQDDIPVDIPKSIPEKDHYVYLRGYYDGERATIDANDAPISQ